MPVIDGIKFAQMIRGTEDSWAAHLASQGRIGKYKTQKACPIIAVTAHSEYTLEQLEEVGIDDVMLKPI
jgi:CheY-like chemotaxis protein